MVLRLQRPLCVRLCASFALFSSPQQRCVSRVHLSCQRRRCTYTHPKKHKHTDEDAKRDLKDSGAGFIPTMSLNEVKYESQTLATFEVRCVGSWRGCVSLTEGILCVFVQLLPHALHAPTFFTYSLSFSPHAFSRTHAPTAQGILFVTYSTSIGQSRQVNMFEEAETRVDQLVQWAGGAAFNGACVRACVRAERRDDPSSSIRPTLTHISNSHTRTPGALIFDEGHKAKRLVPEKEVSGKVVKVNKSTKTALCVDDIQQRLPKARVCYVSATGASSLENLGYMTRYACVFPLLAALSACPHDAISPCACVLAACLPGRPGDSTHTRVQSLLLLLTPTTTPSISTHPNQ